MLSYQAHDTKVRFYNSIIYSAGCLLKYNANLPSLPEIKNCARWVTTLSPECRSGALYGASCGRLDCRGQYMPGHDRRINTF